MRKTVLLYPAVRLTALLLSVCFLLTSVFPCITYAENSDNGPAITSPAAILMEASTGQVIYEKDADTVLHPASITKIMTLILIFDALNSGKINLTDDVTVSEYAASMGGSQVFLEPGETQTVETMINAINVSGVRSS